MFENSVSLIVSTQAQAKRMIAHLRNRSLLASLVRRARGSNEIVLHLPSGWTRERGYEALERANRETR